jgi:uncharacterized protein YdbL (DUF1318 family)
MQDPGGASGVDLPVIGAAAWAHLLWRAVDAGLVQQTLHQSNELHHGWVNDNERSGWLLISYRVPNQPSTARVAAWRRLHRLGALYLGSSTCLLPVDLADDRALGTVAEGITGGGGSIETYRVEAFTPEAQQALVQQFNADRDAEYAEVAERAQALVAELDQESRRGKFTFAEVEENEADLVKLRRWLAAIGRRDRYAASGRAAAGQAVAQADRELRVFTERSARADDEAGNRADDQHGEDREDEPGGVR